MKTLEEAPAARKALLDNHSNLNKVADYCENKYSNVRLSSSSQSRHVAVSVCFCSNLVVTVERRIVRKMQTNSFKLFSLGLR